MRQLNKIVNESSGSETDTPDSAIPISPGLLGFSIDLDVSDISGSSTERNIGVKKSKIEEKKGGTGIKNGWKNGYSLGRKSTCWFVEKG